MDVIVSAEVWGKMKTVVKEIHSKAEKLETTLCSLETTVSFIEWEEDQDGVDISDVPVTAAEELRQLVKDLKKLMKQAVVQIEDVPQG